MRRSLGPRPGEITPLLSALFSHHLKFKLCILASKSLPHPLPAYLDFTAPASSTSAALPALVLHPSASPQIVF